ncbi:alpha/beta hydrolase [Streptomyces malaysiensis]|uniref:alpha/beta hydrolase n=1 Tax=Streptomyces malaysiensis TaxID=92644 RepID=UPI002B2E4B7F|nr:alpha/beta hydrolase [Streptomyces malaysiensis]
MPDPVEIRRGVEVHRDIEYRRTAGAQILRFDLYRPVRATEPLPAVAYFHGGGWTRGTRADYALDRLVPVAAAGVVVVSASYRFSQDSAWPAQLEDAAAAVDHVVAHAEEFGVDPARVSVWGASAGGHIATMLAVGRGVGAAILPASSGRAIHAAVAFHAPADLIALQTEPTDPGALLPAFVTDPDAPRGHPEARLVGAMGPGERLDALRAASPVVHAGPSAAPLLLVTGNRDAMMPLSQPRRLASALAAAGVEHQLLIVDGATHEDSAFHTPAVLGAVTGWITAERRSVATDA